MYKQGKNVHRYAVRRGKSDTFGERESLAYRDTLYKKGLGYRDYFVASPVSEWVLEH